MNSSLGGEIQMDADEENRIMEFEVQLINPNVFRSMKWLLLWQISDSGGGFLPFRDFLVKLPRWLSLIQSLPCQRYQFSNHLEQWILAYQKYPVAIDQRLVTTCENPTSLEYPSVSSLLAMFLIELHRGLTSVAFQRKHSFDLIECDKNHAECTAYINGLFDCYSRLVVLRLDFSYRKEIAHTKTFEDIRRDLDKMRNNARHNDTIFKGLEGYIFKIEYGLDKKIHAHALLFLNGHIRKPSSDVNHAEAIGEYWKNTITKGDGIYWNCNAHKKKYRYNAIGLVQHDDIEKRSYLIMAMKYLCKKTRQVIKPRDKPQTKTLTKGDLRNRNPNLGRPRERFS
jgi:hypothetical protein